MAGVAHTLWVFDLASTTARLSGNQVQTLTNTVTTLNNFFLNAIADNVRVTSAVAASTTGPVVSTGAFDAVVFLVSDPNRGVNAQVGEDVSIAVSDPNKLGLTIGPLPGGCISEVYWTRCMNDWEAASAIIHEAAHQKSNNDPGMHTFVIPNMGGDAAVRVFAARGYRGNQWMSGGDDEYYTAHVPSAVTLRTTVPTSP